MSTLGWIALVAVAALAVVIPLALNRRRRRNADGDRPRTVADLVRLRAAEGAGPAMSAAEPTGEKPALPVEIPGAGSAERPDVASSDEVGTDLAVSGSTPPDEDPTDRGQGAEATPVSEPAEAGGAGAEVAGVEPAGPEAGDAEPVVSEAEPVVSEDAVPTAAEVPAARAALDTPWGRAARMADGDDAPPLEYVPRAPVEPGAGTEPVVAGAVPPVWTAPGHSADDDWSGWADWAEVDAEEDDERPAPRAAAADLDFTPPSPAAATPALLSLVPPVVAEPETEVPETGGPRRLTVVPKVTEAGAAVSLGKVCAEMPAVAEVVDADVAGSGTDAPAGATAAATDSDDGVAEGGAAEVVDMADAPAGASVIAGVPAAGVAAVQVGDAEVADAADAGSGAVALAGARAAEVPGVEVADALDAGPGADAPAGSAAIAGVSTAGVSTAGLSTVEVPTVGVAAGEVAGAEVSDTAVADPGEDAGTTAEVAAAEAPVAGLRTAQVPAVGAPAGEAPAVGTAAAPADAEPVSGATRRRRSLEEQAAEQAAADLALLRTFGFADPSLRPDSAPVVSLFAARDPEPEPGPGEQAQPVRFRAVRRDGTAVQGAAVTLLDDRGRESSAATADSEGRGDLLAPQPGAYVLVSTAPGHQPGAVAITVDGKAVDADVLLARSASVGGGVFGEDGPVEGARVTLVQDGEIVDAVSTAEDGTYRIEDLAAGEYGFSVAAAGCEPTAMLLLVPDETDVSQDVDLEPAGLPAAERRGGDIPGDIPADLPADMVAADGPRG